jgi:hypothetical protein
VHDDEHTIYSLIDTPLHDLIGIYSKLKDTSLAELSSGCAFFVCSMKNSLLNVSPKVGWLCSVTVNTYYHFV